MSERFKYTEAEEFFGTGFQPLVIRFGDGTEVVMGGWGEGYVRQLGKVNGVTETLQCLFEGVVDEWYELSRSWIEMSPADRKHAELIKQNVGREAYAILIRPYLRYEREFVPDIFGRKLWMEAG